MKPAAEPDVRAAAKRAAANKTTALILASIAIVFFIGVIAAQMIGTPTVSIAVIGSAVLLYLLVAIGRSLRK
ncbi:MAG TPA: cytochrome oxidase small assembly protein [Casimicrobiaceae bacterium]|nr:cytochrome oxidase small assembly protein [Casimicrobiaceae bacterium]